MKTRTYREFLTRKWVAIGILSFLTFFMTSCGDGSDFVGEVPPASDSDFIDASPPPADADFIGEASPPADEHAPSQESPSGSQESNQCDMDHCDLVPQEIHSDRILAIGDSITAWYQKPYCGCGQSYSDYASIEIDEYIQNEAVSATRLSGEISWVLPSIPRQYANATADNRSYDVVILTGGGNDLFFECAKTRQSCTDRCGAKMEEIVEEMETLVTDIVRDGSDVILVGYYQVRQSPPARNGKLAWYGECFSELASRYEEIADSSPHVSFVSTTDLANPDDSSDYAEDGLHPGIALAEKIGERVADAF